MQFVEKSPIEQGYAQVFSDTVAPQLDALDVKRAELISTGKRHFAYAVGVGAVLGIILAVWQDVIFGVFVLAFSLIPAFALRSNQAKKWSGEVAETVMPSICEFLGDITYDRKATGSFSAAQAQELGLVAKYDSAVLEDHMIGTWNGTQYEMVEAKLTRSSSNNDSSNNSTVFQGLLFRIALPQPAPTRILIARDFGQTFNKLAGFFGSGSGRGMPRVETGHEEFEKDFELHAMSPEGVLDYLPPAFLDNLVAIGASESDSGTLGMIAAFDGGDFWLSLERKKPFLEMGKINEPVEGIIEELHLVFDDMALIRRIIDRLQS